MNSVLPLGNALGNFIIVTGRLVGKEICPLPQRSPEALILREQHWQLLVALASALFTTIC